MGRINWHRLAGGKWTVLYCCWFLTATFHLALADDVGGISFAMTAASPQEIALALENYTIPTFHSAREADKWAHDIKYIKPIYRKLTHHINDLLKKANINTSEFELSVEVDHVNRILIQYAWCNMALHIMRQYKVSSSDKAMLAPKFRTRQDAIRFANKYKGNYDAIEAVEQRVKWLILLLGINEDQFDKLASTSEELIAAGRALKIMERFKKLGIEGDPAQVGSSFYAGSYPIYK